MAASDAQVEAVGGEVLCWSRGPRIGDSGVPYCKLPENHDGLHKPAPSDGWSADVVWGKPDMREPWHGAPAASWPLPEGTRLVKLPPPDDEAPAASDEGSDR